MLRLRLFQHLPSSLLCAVCVLTGPECVILCYWPRGVDKHQRTEQQASSDLQGTANAALICSALKFSKVTQLQLSYLSRVTGISGFSSHLCETLEWVCE